VTVGLVHYLVLSGILFGVGLYGVLAKRNVIVILMCVEIMLNASNIALVAFSRYVVPALLTGQIFALFVIVVAAAEVAVGVAIVFTIYRKRHSVDINDFDLMKW